MNGILCGPHHTVHTVQYDAGSGVRGPILITSPSEADTDPG